MSYQQLTPELTQRIINEAVNSNLSSYQIALKYSITKSVVDRLCRRHLGSEVYNKRESLSFDYLASQIKGLRQKKYSSDRVAQALGLYKTTCFTLIFVTSTYRSYVTGISTLDTIPYIPFWKG